MMTISTRPLWRTPALALLALASLAPAARAGPSARGPVRAHGLVRAPPGGASRGAVPAVPEQSVAPRRLAKASKSKSNNAGKREAAHPEQVRN